MKHSILVFAILTLIFAGCSSGSIDLGEFFSYHEKDGLMYKKGKDKPFTGEATRTAGGVITEQRFYVDGKMHGVFFKKTDPHYWINSRGVRENLGEKMRAKGTYFKGVKVGLYKEWDSDGNEEEWNYYKHKDSNSSPSEMLHGLHKRWDKDGELKLEESYVMGELRYRKEWRLYSRIEANHKGWKRHGEYVEWYSNDTMKMKAFYIDGELDLKMIEWYDNGKVKKEAVYENGSLISENIFPENDPWEIRKSGKTTSSSNTRRKESLLEKRKAWAESSATIFQSDGLNVRNLLSGRNSTTLTMRCDQFDTAYKKEFEKAGFPSKWRSIGFKKVIMEGKDYSYTWGL